MSTTRMKYHCLHCGATYEMSYAKFNFDITCRCRERNAVKFEKGDKVRTIVGEVTETRVNGDIYVHWPSGFHNRLRAEDLELVERPVKWPKLGAVLRYPGTEGTIIYLGDGKFYDRIGQRIDYASTIDWTFYEEV